MKRKGWKGESARHSLAARGVKTRTKQVKRGTPLNARGKIKLAKGEDGSFEIATKDGNRLVLSKNLTALAAAFGWEGWIDTEYASMDDMEKAEELAARKFLKEHVGTEVDDPGYFRRVE